MMQSVFRPCTIRSVRRVLTPTARTSIEPISGSSFVGRDEWLIDLEQQSRHQSSSFATSCSVASMIHWDPTCRSRTDSIPFGISSSSSSLSTRTYSSTVIHTAKKNPLDQFRDSVDRQTRAQEKVGRSWSAKELRRKSYDDLHRLWYVLYKERNMLLTEQQLSRRRQLIFPQPERLYKVQKSMGAIKQVLGERKRVKVAEHLASQLEKSMLKESDQLTTHDDLDVPIPRGEH